MTQVREAHEVRRSHDHRFGVGIAVVLGVLLLVGAACSSSGSSASSSGAKADPAVLKGISFVVEPTNKATPVTPPSGFLNCTANKLSSTDRVAIAKITSSDDVPADLGVRVTRAGRTCNGDYLVASFKSELSTGDNAIPGITASQAECAAKKAVPALAGLDDKTVGASTESGPLTKVVATALDGCYPVTSFLDSTFRQNDSSITSSQLSCIHGKLPKLTWGSVMAKSDDFQTQLQSAATACGVGG
jgi:hypothetical protein